MSKVIYGKEVKKLDVTLKVALFSPEEIKLWLRSLEEKASCTYSVHRKGSCTGERIMFKQFLNYHHNTRSKSTYDPSVKNHTKNLNCPSSLSITLKAAKEKFRSKPENAPDPEMPCVIVFQPVHNHHTDSADAFRFRRVSENTRLLIELFKSGHSAASAYESIKIELQMCNENYESLLGL